MLLVSGAGLAAGRRADTKLTLLAAMWFQNAASIWTCRRQEHRP